MVARPATSTTKSTVRWACRRPRKPPGRNRRAAMRNGRAMSTPRSLTICAALSRQTAPEPSERPTAMRPRPPDRYAKSDHAQARDPLHPAGGVARSPRQHSKGTQREHTLSHGGTSRAPHGGANAGVAASARRASPLVGGGGHPASAPASVYPLSHVRSSWSPRRCSASRSKSATVLVRISVYGRPARRVWCFTGSSAASMR